MEEQLIKYQRAAECIRDQFQGEVPFASVILGSGLGDFGHSLEIKKCIPFRNIPGFPATTVSGHAGELCLARGGGRLFILQRGRFHYYEGYGLEQILFPVRVYHLLGIRRLVVTNAAGGINPGFVPGDLMLIRDHIGLFAPSPLRGPGMEVFGPRFPDMTRVYTPSLRKMALLTALQRGMDIREGVYAFAQGPMFETPAEIRALAALGADAVGMSTVPETIAAAHSGMEVLGISMITNMAAGLSGDRISHEEVMDVSRKSAAAFNGFLTDCLLNWQDTKEEDEKNGS
ncbi:MAG TPA: purine-nucleoside phosphorylase [Clostridiales bacterium]|nr:purine-nucleoside phosphorylase [Clostridiales bacterium]